MIVYPPKIISKKASNQFAAKPVQYKIVPKTILTTIQPSQLKKAITMVMNQSLSNASMNATNKAINHKISPMKTSVLVI